MRKLWMLLPCAVLLLVSGCSSAQREVCKAGTGGVTGHGESATAGEVAGPAGEVIPEDATGVVHATSGLLRPEPRRHSDEPRGSGGQGTNALPRVHALGEPGVPLT